MTLAEHYYRVGNDLAEQAADMARISRYLLGCADRLSERDIANAQAQQAAAADEPSTTP